MPEDPIRDLLQSPVRSDEKRSLRWVWIPLTIVGVAALGFWLLRDPPAPPGDQAGLGTTTTTPATADPAIILEDPLVLAGVAGPKPEFDPSGLGMHEPLRPEQEVSLAERGWIAGLDYVPPDSASSHPYFFFAEAITLKVTSAIGVIPPSGRILLAEGSAAFPGPGFGGPAACLRVQTGSWGAPTECFAHDPDISARPAFVGWGLLDVVAWTHLPEETSIAVLSVNGEDRAWQAPVSGVAAFTYQMEVGDRVRLRMLDTAGAEIGVADRAHPPPPTGLYVEPIGGYADFSGRAFDTISEVEISEAVVECLTDNGVAAEVFVPRDGDMIVDGVLRPGDGDPIADRGMAWVLDPSVEADVFHARCLAGLNLPDRPPPDAPDRETYEELAWIGSCLLALGDEEMTQPPSFDDWVASDPDTRWHPWGPRTQVFLEDAEVCFE